MDRIRVLRVVEYVGSRDEIESIIGKSLHGKRHIETGYIQATTLGEFPDIMKSVLVKPKSELK